MACRRSRPPAIDDSVSGDFGGRSAALMIAPRMSIVRWQFPHTTGAITARAARHHHRQRQSNPLHTPLSGKRSMANEANIRPFRSPIQEQTSNRVGARRRLCVAGVSRPTCGPPASVRSERSNAMISCSLVVEGVHTKSCRLLAIRIRLRGLSARTRAVGFTCHYGFDHVKAATLRYEDSGNGNRDRGFRGVDRRNRTNGLAAIGQTAAPATYGVAAAPVYRPIAGVRLFRLQSLELTRADAGLQHLSAAKHSTRNRTRRGAVVGHLRSRLR